MYKLRIARLRELLKRQRLDALLVTVPANRRYLSGFRAADGQLGETSGALLISPGDALLLTDFRYELSARAQAPLFTTHIYRRGLPQGLAEILKGSRIKRLGYEAEGLLVLQRDRLELTLKGVELVPTQGLVAELRRIKDSTELAAIRRSLALMEGVLSDYLEGDFIGRSERELALETMRRVEDAGAEGPAFDPIVAAGPNGAEPHAEPGDTLVEPGQPVIMDLGARLDGYASDITRTVLAGGIEHLDPTFREVYPVVRRAQQEAMARIRPGMTGAQADAIAREVIDQAGYGRQFGHSLGHGVGIDTHEDPSLGPGSDQVLEPGMVFTIEPGIYLPGWGGVRLEQMVVLEPGGCRLLNGLNGFYEF